MEKQTDKELEDEILEILIQEDTLRLRKENLILLFRKYYKELDKLKNIIKELSPCNRDCDVNVIQEKLEEKK